MTALHGVLTRKAQNDLVRAIYQFPDEAIDMLPYLKPEIFESLGARWAMGVMQRFIASTHRTPPSPAVAMHEFDREVHDKTIKTEHAETIRKFIGKLAVPVADKSYLLERGQQWAQVKALQGSILKMLPMATGEQRMDFVQWEKDTDELLTLKARSEGDPGINYFESFDARQEHRKRFEANGVETGTVLDDHLRARGLAPGQLGVVVAPPGRGKTMALIFFGKSAVKAGKRVLHVSLELDQHMVGERYDACFTGTPLDVVTKQGDKLRRQLDVIKREHGANLHIKDFPSGSLTLDMLAAYIRRLERTAFVPDVLMLDYADIMSLSGFQRGDDNTYNALGSLYVGLRGLAQKLRIPVWTATQSNRMSLEKDKIGMGDLADSFKKAHHADVMVALSATDVEVERKMARLSLVKNRSGAPSMGKGHPVGFDPATLQIGELPGSGADDDDP